MARVKGRQQLEGNGDDAGTDERLACGSIGKLVCSFHCGCLYLGSFVRADLSSPSPSSAPCHRKPALVQTACSLLTLPIRCVRLVLIVTAPWDTQYIFSVGGLTKITSEVVFEAVVMFSENGLVWHSL